MANCLYLSGSMCFLVLASMGIKQDGLRFDNALALCGALAFALGTAVNMVAT